MRTITLALAALLGGVFAAGAALAHCGGYDCNQSANADVALGLTIGGWSDSSYYGLYAYAPYRQFHRYYVPPPSESVTAAPPHYAGPPVEVRALLPNYQYFCDRANAYYPDVTECAGGWTYFPPEPRRY